MTIVIGLVTAIKALMNSHHDHQYLDVTTNFTNFTSFTTFSETIFAIF